MLKKIRPRAYRHYVDLPVLGPVVEGFVQWSADQRYTVGTIKNQLKDLLRFSEFFRSRDIRSAVELTQITFDEARHYFHREAPERVGTLTQLRLFLENKHGFSGIAAPPASRVEAELKLFVEHLERVKGMSESTIRSHRRYISRFLSSIGFEENQAALQGLTSTQVDDFITACAKTLNRHSLQHVVGHLRAFLSFLFCRNAIPLPLHERIDSPRIYRQEKLPRSLPWKTVSDLLSSIDREDPQGNRNYAMLLLMATYGLRSKEIVTLTLDRIDWRSKTIRVSQEKTAQLLCLPLTDAVAEALISYLKDVRPNFPLREIFLRMRAPLGRLKPTGVTEAFQRQVRLSGLDIPFQGPHCLRHSLAVHLLRQGVSMKAIGDLLGHRHGDSTNAYLRLVLEDLRVVPLEVPALPPSSSTVEPAISAASLPQVRSRVSDSVRRLESSLAPEISAYLKLHHSLGKGYVRERGILYSLDAFLTQRQESKLNGAIFNLWSESLSEYSPTNRRNHMRIVRNFCIYRQRTHPDCFIPDENLFPKPQPYAPAFIFSTELIAELLLACRRLPFNPHCPLRPEALRISIVLLFTCGLRRGELLALRWADFNVGDGTLFIQATKFHKQRILPISVSVAQELHAYLGVCGSLGFPMEPELPIIRSYYREKKQAYTGTGLLQNWRWLCASQGIITSRGIPPRIHDLRHSFAVNVLLAWYKAGMELQAKLPFLSTYMGHICIASTYHYLSFIEPLRSEASTRFEAEFGRLVTTDTELEGGR